MLVAILLGIAVAVKRVSRNRRRADSQRASDHIGVEMNATGVPEMVSARNDNSALKNSNNGDTFVTVKSADSSAGQRTLTTAATSNYGMVPESLHDTYAVGDLAI